MCAIAGSVILLGLKVQPAAFLLIVAHPSSHTCHIMLDKRPSVLKVNHMFVPWPLKPVQFDKQNVKLYPVIDLTMKPLKHAHSFQINKTVLAALGINRHALLNTLGTCFCCVPLGYDRPLGLHFFHFYTCLLTLASTRFVVNQDSLLTIGRFPPDDVHRSFAPQGQQPHFST